MFSLNSFIFVVLFIIQVFSIVMLKNSKDSKYCGLFKGINISDIIFSTFELIINISLIKEYLFPVICCVSLAACLILLLIFRNLKPKIDKEIKQNNLNNNKIENKVNIIDDNKLNNKDENMNNNKKDENSWTKVAAWVIIAIFCFPILINLLFWANLLIRINMYDSKKDMEKYNANHEAISSSVLNYLNNTYGDNDFKIVSIDNRFTTGWTRSDFLGYSLKISTSLLKKNFEFYVVGDEFRGSEHVNDHFLEDYYTEKISDYLASEYHYNFWISLGNVSHEFGHIPTFDEIIEYNIYKNMTITAPKKYDITGDVKSFLTYFTNEFREYLNITKDFNYRFDKITDSGSSIYYINIEDNKINIDNTTNKKNNKTMTEDVVAAKEKTLQYLNEKYGDNEYIVLDYSVTNMISLNNKKIYEFTMSSNVMQNSFKVIVEENTTMKTSSTDDDFVKEYYKEKMIDCLIDNNIADISLEVESFDEIPGAKGKIPTFNQLIKNNIIKDIEVYRRVGIFKNKVQDGYSVAEEIATKLKENLNIANDITITYYNGKTNNSDIYTISMHYNSINIASKDKSYSIKTSNPKSE